MILCKMGSESVCGKKCCCWDCDERATCKDVCDAYEDGKEAERYCIQYIPEETSLAAFQAKEATVIQKMVDLLKQKKALEEQEKGIREQLVQAMGAYNVKSFENDLLKVVFVDSTTKTTLDSKALKKDHPDLVEAYSKVSKVSGSVRITLK